MSTIQTAYLHVFALRRSRQIVCGIIRDIFTEIVWYSVRNSNDNSRADCDWIAYEIPEDLSEIPEIDV